mmetsp:Transcript_25430/g.65726  ORF Transcript_25430/g.65726 Transcript_25430/m.65726 type:complete len:678 (-) Transcript_25430:87-2120(-)
MDQAARELMREPTQDVAHRILRACAWPERTKLLCLNRAWGALAHSAVLDWCDELSATTRTYVPAAPHGRERTPAEWRQLLRRLLATQYAWSPYPVADESAPSAAADRKVRIQVCARFRPRQRAVAGATSTADEGVDQEALDARGAQRVVLPLHQRLQLIRTSHKCSASDAQRLLWSGGAAGNDPFASPKGMAELPLGEVTNVSADPDGAHGTLKPPTAKAVHARADGDGATGEGSNEASVAGVVSACSGGGVDGAQQAAIVAAAAVSTSAGVVALTDASVVFCAPTIGLREFCYTRAFGAEATQADVYEDSLRPLVVDMLNGRSGCLLAFGQTGSGKTYSVSGADEEAATSLPRDASSSLLPSAGLVPRAVHELLCAIAARRTTKGIHADLALSAVEVFGNDVLDLLNEGEALGAWRGVAARALAVGYADRRVNSAEDASALLLTADRAKRRAATAMNERSSRAHTVLLLTLTQRSAEGLELRSTLCLADLGGSEQLKRSQATGERLREAVRINLGLLALKRCVTALTEGHSHAPFQDSALTQLLRPGLSGRAQAVVLVCASPDPVDATETLEALRFGELAAVVESDSRQHSTAALMAETLRALDTQIERVQQAIVSKERWEQVVERRADERAEGLVDTGVEEKRTFKLVGAEAERTELEELLARRRELVGDTDMST